MGPRSGSGTERGEKRWDRARERGIGVVQKRATLIFKVARNRTTSIAHARTAGTERGEKSWDRARERGPSRD
jgi:hypothetical protein